jgi:hypothetical protein
MIKEFRFELNIQGQNMYVAVIVVSGQKEYSFEFKSSTVI